MTIQLVAVDEHNYPQVLDLLEVCFPDDVRQYFERHHRRDPAYSFSQARALSDNGRIVSHVQVFHRELGYGLDTIPYGGIGDVGTHPDWRGQGLSGKLLQESVDYMLASALPLSMLFTGQHSHYAKYGWVQVPQSVLQFDLPADLPPEPGGFIVRPFVPDDIADLHTLYRRDMSGLTGPEARSLPYMSAQLDWLPFQGDVRWDVFDRVGHPSGYVRTRVEGEELHLLDLATGTDDLDRLAIARILHHAAESSCSRVTAAVAPFSRFARTFAESVSAEIQPGPHRMMRLNSLRGVLDRIQPTLARRLRDPVPRQPFALKVGDEAVRVDASGSGVAFANATGDEALVELSPETFLSLLMGQPGSHRLLGAPGVDLRATGVLQLMFPQTGNLTWQADTF